MLAANARAALRAPPPTTSRRARARANASKDDESRTNEDLYATLGVDARATAKEIKSAYRKRALKLHPDVNKASDAAERFREAKMAYEVLVDEKSRRAYDAARSGSAKAREGKKTSSTKEWANDGWRRRTWSSTEQRASANASSSRSAPKEEEEFYGFAQFFADLEAELEVKAKKRAKDAPPKTLWEELFEIGEEFVEFLEETAPVGKGKDARDVYEPPGPTRAEPKSTSAKSQSVDDMLAQLKRDMGK